MKKTHVRAYSIANGGDIAVSEFKKGSWVDLSPHYSDVPRDRGLLRVDTAVDVFRYENGDLAWTLTPNGNDAGAAASTRLLFDIFLEDLAMEGEGARAF